MKSAHSLSSAFKMHSESDAVLLYLWRHPSANHRHLLPRSLQKPPDRSMLRPLPPCSLFAVQQPEQDFKNVAETVSLLAPSPQFLPSWLGVKSQVPAVVYRALYQCSSTWTLLTFGPDNCLCRDSPAHSRCLYPRGTSGTPASSCESQKYLQTLPNAL